MAFLTDNIEGELRLKIRVFALAKELKLDSKVLIDYCRKAGIVLKSSALASVSQEERDKVVKFIRESDEGASGASTEAAPLTPVRETTHTKLSNKVPQIKSVAPQPPSTGVGEKRRRRSTTATDSAGERSKRKRSTAAEPQSAPPEAPAATATRPQQSTSSGTTMARGPLARVRLSEDKDAKGPGVESAPGASGGKAPAQKSPQPMVPVSRENYISASGTSLKSVTPMTPRGSTGESSTSSARSGRSKTSRQLPKLATPSAFKPPPGATAGPAAPPAQKPDLRLPMDVVTQSRPLQEYFQQHEEEKRQGKRTADVKPGEKAPAKKLGGKRSGGLIADREARQRSRKRRGTVDDDQGGRQGATRAPRGRGRKKAKSGPSVPLRTSARIASPITVRSLSEAIGRPANTLLTIMFQRGDPVTINASLTEDIALELAMECGVDLEIRRQRDIEDELLSKLASSEEDADKTSRPPIVTILGHVDHGKTTLLDKIRSANVAGGEAGGITQHIAAYQVTHDGQKITFVDTPGHAAFGKMRARGANVTDIVVLVVAADDGVMPQTVEAISHAKVADVPIVVALNKIDVPGVDDQRVLQQLSANNVLPSEWGGDSEVVRTSALTGQGLDELLKTLLLTAELHEYSAVVDRPGHGACLESFRDEGRGVLTWLIVQQGTLKIGDVVLCGPAYGRIRAIYNDQGEEIDEAGPSSPIKVAGLDIVPGTGDHFFVMSDLDEAREVAERRRRQGRTEVLAEIAKPRTLEDILEHAKHEGIQDLPLIIKADTPGSAEALRSELAKLDHPEVRVKIKHEGVGGVNESDVYLAKASGAIIVAFHVIPEDRAADLAAKEGVEIRRYSIIYEVTDEIKLALEGMLKPEVREVATARALVLKTFHISRYGTIAGCRILSGKLDRNNRLHIIRDQKVLNHGYGIASLKREKEDAKEVREGMECGIRLEGFNDIKEGDLLEAYRVEEVPRTLD